MSSKTIYHYVYRITNLVERKHYYGKRSSKILPQDDIGIKYFSSSRDKEFKNDQKQNPQNYRYKVVAVFDSVEDALTREIKLHEMFDVGRNLKFYNRQIQTSTKFNSTGKVKAIDKQGNRFFICATDYRLTNGELSYISSGVVTVKDSEGNYSSVSVDDPRYKSGELKFISSGMLVAKDSYGNTFRVDKTDSRILDGTLIPWNKGMISVKDSEGNHSSVYSDDPRYISGELVPTWKGKSHSKETVLKMKATHKQNGHSQGEKNSQFGTCWITDGTTNKKVSKDLQIPDGWYKGRITRK